MSKVSGKTLKTLLKCQTAEISNIGFFCGGYFHNPVWTYLQRECYSLALGTSVPHPINVFK